MTYKDLKKKYSNIISLLGNHKIKDTLDNLEELTKYTGNPDYINQLHLHKDTYTNMLRYSFSAVEDPEREKIYARLKRSLHELADNSREAIITNQGYLTIYRVKRDIEKYPAFDEEKTTSMLENIEFNREMEELMEHAGGIKMEGDNQHSQTLKKIFNILWMTDKFKESEINLVNRVMQSENFPWYYQSLMVSSITLSLLRIFDPAKINILLDIYDKQKHQVWQRALVGLVIALYKYDHKLLLYPEIIERLKVYKGNKNLERSIETIFVQFIKSKESEKLAKKIQEEILPEMMKLSPRLENKLDLENIISDAIKSEKNPEWETFFKDSPDLYNKLEEFSMMQMEGSDVFLSAFAMLKQFPFFHQLPNWFLPFYTENQTLKDSMGDMKEGFDTKKFTEGLAKSSFLCNSDKYSFCLNVERMPSVQKSMMMELFNMEIKAMNELQKEDEMLNKPVQDKTIFTQYLQDLYRFFRLHPLKVEFEDIFTFDFAIYRSSFFKILMEDDTIVRNIAEFYFERNYFNEAIGLFTRLNEQENNYEIIEKTGFSYQQLGNFDKALEYYQKAELFDKNRVWLLKKIAFCYRKLKQPSRALEYYENAEKIEPENLHLQANLGHTYLDMKDHETALKYYFKVEYLDPKNFKVHRPIAWCSFVLGKFDTAKKYFQKVIDKEPTRHDYLNLGHVEWCTGNVPAAKEKYMKSLQISDYNYKWFEEEMHGDKTYLLKHGINQFDIPLMIDLIRFENG